MGILVRNHTRRLMGFGGARINPGEAEECNATKADAEKHPFFTTGQLSIERKGSQAASKKKSAASTGNQSDEPSEEELVTAIATMEDADRLRELSEDSRQAVSDAAVNRILELEGE